MAKGGGKAIRTLTANLTTDLFGWNSGLQAANTSLDKFYKGVSAKLDKPLSFGRGIADIGKSFGQLGATAVGPLAGIGKGLASIGTSAVSVVAGVGAIGVGIATVGVAAAVGIAAFANAGIDRIDQLTDTAQRIGVTTDALSELRYAANLSGGDAETLDNALEKLNQNLGDSKNQITPTTEALARLGLSAKDLAKDSPDAAFTKIVKGFEGIPDAASKASLAADIFGKQGVKLVNVLSAGSDGLQQLRDEAKKFGVSVSQLDAAKIASAKDSLDRVGAAVEGIGNKIAVSLAPWIESASTLFTDWFASVWDGGKIVDTVIDGIVHGFASAADIIADIGPTTQATFGLAVSSIGEAITVVGQLVSVLGLVNPAMTAIGQAAVTVGQQFVQAGNNQVAVAGKQMQALQANKPSDVMLAAYDEWKKKAKEAANAVAEGVTRNLEGNRANLDLAGSISLLKQKYQDQINTIGLTGAALETYKLKQQGATDAELKDIAALEKEYLAKKKVDDKRKERINDIESYGKSLTESIKTPQEKYAEGLKKLEEAIGAGDFKGDQEKAKGVIARESGINPEVKLSGAMGANSDSGYTLLAASLSGKTDGFASLEKLQGQGNLFLGQMVEGIDSAVKLLGFQNKVVNI